MAFTQKEVPSKSNDNPLESIREYLHTECLSILDDDPGVLSISFNNAGEQARVVDSQAAPANGNGPNGVPHGLNDSVALRAYLRDYLQAWPGTDIRMLSDNVFFCMLPVADAQGEFLSAMTAFRDANPWVRHSPALGVWISAFYITGSARVPRNAAVGKGFAPV
eukprot:TRINITY_DN12581_c0_g1_i1.p1 TRINITY_DN12581_c0_g1~~TRINITY_DN12581_c0_g1_i1.p1  ORF type:complete len:164 (-),score=20.64 TRINITY_DN12581_c0_g1_i1:45-536(-)